MLITREEIKKLQAVKSEENKEIIDEIVNYFNTLVGVGYNTDELVYLPKELSEKYELLKDQKNKGHNMKRDIKFEIRFNKEEMERIEKIAKKLNMPKAKLIRNLTLLGLEDAELYRLLGLKFLSKKIIQIQKKAFIA